MHPHRDGSEADRDDPARITAEFVGWIRSDRFTCLAARAAVRRGELVTRVYPSLSADPDCSPELYRDLVDFAAAQLDQGSRFASFTAIFVRPDDLDEEQFERALWNLLGRLHRIDAGQHAWAAGFSADPSALTFAFSLAGRAFFVAGLNPRASRISRRFSRCVLVFNAHEQFASLKETGQYYSLQRKIRQRERALQGDINPMLGDHGENLEAAQYSGRHVGPDWTCPFPFS